MKISEILRKTAGICIAVGMLFGSGSALYNMFPDTAYAETDWTQCEYETISSGDSSLRLVKCRQTNVTEINIPSHVGDASVVSIAADAFVDCTSALTINLPSTITTIAEGALASPKLNMINVDPDNSVFSSTEDGVLIDKSQKTLVQFPAGKLDSEGKPLTKYTVPDGIITVAKSAFKNAKSLQYIELPDGLENINNDAFSGCVSLLEIKIPESVKSIKEKAFFGCTKLALVHLGRMEEIPIVSTPEPTPDPSAEPIPSTTPNPKATPKPTPEPTYQLHSNLATIGDSAFENCPAISAIRIPGTCSSIGSRAFFGDKGIAKITIDEPALDGDGNSIILDIKSEAFSGCSNSGLSELTLPDSVENIGERAFYGAGGKGFVVNMSDKLQKIEKEAFSTSSLVEVSIPYTLTALADGVFKDCTSLIKAELNFENSSVMDKIGEDAFYGCSKLSSLILPKNVTTIGKRAFYGTAITRVDIPKGVSLVDDETFYNCKNLVEITIPSATKKIGVRAFGNCAKLTEVNVDGDLKTICDEAFINCSVLKNFNFKNSNSLTDTDEVVTDEDGNQTTVVIPAMGNKAFFGCKSLTKVILSENMTEIPSEAFSSCTGITEAEIPKTIRKIGTKAFSGCTGMTKLLFTDINLDSEYAYKLEIEPEAFTGCTKLASVSFSNNIEAIPTKCFFKSGIKELDIPGNIESIGESAFDSSTSLEKLIMHDGVTTMGKGAFNKCSKLASVAFSGTMTSIPENAFMGTGIKELTIPKNIKEINAHAFDGCKQLTKIVLEEDGVEKLGDYAFANCNVAASVDMGTKVSSMGEYVFNNMPKLEEFKISPALTEIPAYTFTKSFNNASDITLTIPNTVKVIKTNAFNSSSVPNIVIEDGDTPNSLTIEPQAFTKAGVKTIKFSNTIEKLPENVFEGCSSLQTLTIPSNIKTIGDYAFTKCTGLTEVTLEEGVESIGTNAFNSCKALTKINLPTTMSVIPSYSFSACTSLAEITIPSNIKTIEEFAFSGCKGLKNLTFEDGIEKLGESAFSSCSGLENIKFASTLAEIPARCFEAITGLKEITIPSNIKTIGDYAFTKCTGLTNVTMEDGVENIGASAFEADAALANIVLPSSLKTIGDKAFVKSAITELNIPGGVERIGTSSFSNNPALSKVVLNDGTKSIGESAFASCKLLESVTYPQTLEQIEDKAFNGCEKLANVNFPYSLQKIGASAFAGCKSIDKLILPESINELAKSAFSGCSSLISATFSGNAPEIMDNSVFKNAMTGFRTYHYVGTTGFDYNDAKETTWYGYLCEEISIDRLDKISDPDKTTYIFGEAQELDRTGMKIVATYSNGDKRDVTSLVTVRGFDGSPLILGKQNVEISYQNSETKFYIEINVIERTLKEITIAQLPNKTEYLRGDELDTTGMIVNGIYDSGQEEPIPLEKCTFMGYSKTTPGTQTITVRYIIENSNGTQLIKSAKFDVHVTDRTLTGVTVFAEKIKYSRNSKYDSEKTKVMALYDNGDNVEVPYGDYDIEGFDTSTLGIKTLVFSYGGFDFELEIEVVEKAPLKLNVSNFRTEYILGQEFVEGDAVVEVEYDNGEKEEIPFGNYEVNLNLSAEPYTCAISYNGLSYTYNVKIVDKVLSGIEVTPPTKTVYAIGEEFDPTGITVTAKYNNNSSAVITDYTISGFNSSSAQKCIVSIIYQNQSKQFTVTVTGNSLIDLDVTSYKKSYQTGEAYDDSLTEVYAVYSDYSRVKINTYQVSGFNSALVGTGNITISYSGISKTLPITILSSGSVASITGIDVKEININPYLVGETYFDRTSIKVSVIYNDGTSVPLGNLDYTVSGFDTSSPGMVIVTIGYLNYTKPIAINVMDTKQQLLNIAFTPPTKTLYSVGDETIDTTGMLVTATYENAGGGSSSVDVTSKCEVSGFDTSSPGTKTVRVSYMGVTKTYNIIVTASTTITGINVTDYTRTYLQNTPFDNNITLYVSFSDGSIKKITNGYEISGFDSSVPGVCIVTVTYMDKSTMFAVNIVGVEEAAKIIGIKATLLGSDEYLVNAPQFDRSSISVEAIKSDGTSDVITNYSVSGFETTIAGNKTLTISYLGFTQTIPIKVVDKSIMGISVKAPSKTVYTQGDSFSTVGMNVMAFYTDGSQEDVTGQAIVGGYDPNLIGKQTVRIIYGDKYEEIEITVEPKMSSICSIEIKNAKISRSNKVTASVIANNTTDNVFSGKLVVAIYEYNNGVMGKMIGMSVSDAIVANGETPLNASFDAEDTESEEFMVTAFLWEDINTMVPITEKAEYII